MTSNQNTRRHPALAAFHPWVATLGGLSLLAAATGCPSPDPEGKYDRFNEQTQDQRDLPEIVDLPPLPTPGDTDTDTDTDTEAAPYPDITGVHLMAISTSVDKAKPLQFLADVQAQLDYAGDGTVTIEFQPLSLDVGSTTEPREEVGESIVVDAPVVGGAFTVEFGETMVVGAANPITGSDIVAELSLAATIRSEDAWCGEVSGTVTSPLVAPLAGSIFAATRLADRSERPLNFPCECQTIGLMGAEDGCIPKPG